VGWHSKEAVHVSLEADTSVLRFKDHIRAALGSAAAGQVFDTCTDIPGASDHSTGAMKTTERLLVCRTLC